jgi:hypothetical protein
VEDGEVVPLDELIVEPPVHQAPVKESIPLTKCGKCGIMHPCRQKLEDVVTVCFFCYRLTQASDDVAAFLRNAYSKPCEFCGDSDRIKNMDHRNMFLKSHAIMDMVNMSLECVKAEVEKCQLLCIPCHKRVTSAEHRYGFIKKKKYMCKMQRSGESVTEIRDKYATLYEKVMNKVYNRIKSGNSEGIIR